MSYLEFFCVYIFKNWFSSQNGELDTSPPLVEHKQHKKKHKKKAKKSSSSKHQAEEADLLGLEESQPAVTSSAAVHILAADENVKVA